MRNSELLQKKFDQVVRTGEIPYQANRRARKVLGILQDGKGGKQEIDLVLHGLDMLAEDLGSLKREAGRVKNQAVARLRKA